MTSPLVSFYDESMTKRVPVNERGIPIIDWGETIPGQKKEKTFYVKNNTRDRVIIRQPYSNDEDLSIDDYPANLLGNESGIVTMSFKPHIERIEPLKSEWGFDLVIG